MKMLLIILLQMFTIHAFGQVKHVVFDLEGTIIVNVPIRFRDNSSEKNQYISVAKQTFRIYPHASATLESLMSMNGVVVHIISNKSSDFIKEILSQIPTVYAKDSNLFDLWQGQELGTIWSEESFEGGTFDLRNVTSDLKNIFLVSTRTDALISKQKKLLYSLPNHYFYENLNQYQNEKVNLQARTDWVKTHEAFVPKTDNDWLESYHRMAIIHERVFTMKMGVTKSFLDYVQETKSNDQFLKLGIEWGNNSHLSKVLSWIVKDNNVVGCEGVDLRTRVKTSSQSISDCQETLTTKSFALDEKECFEFTENLAMIGKGSSCEDDFDNYVTFNPATRKFELKAVDRGKAMSARLVKRHGSFRRTILSNLGNSVMAELSEGRPGCGEEVRRIYKNGGNLFSKKLEKGARLLSTFNFGSGVKDNQYFHLTGSKDFADTFNVSDKEIQKLNGPVEDVFVYNRTKPPQFYSGSSSYHSNWGKVFYLSEDTASLMLYYHGFYGVKFTISPEAKYVNMDPNLFADAMDEVAERHPGIKKFCGTRFDTSLIDAHGTVGYHGLAFLLAEDSGVDAIYYFQANSWFQFITPNSFESAKTLGKVGSGNGGNPSYSAPDKSYLTVPVLSVVSAKYGDVDATAEASRIIDGKIKVNFRANLSGFKGDLKLIVECLPGGIPVGASVKQTFSAASDELATKTLKINCAKGTAKTNSIFYKVVDQKVVQISSTNGQFSEEVVTPGNVNSITIDGNDIYGVGDIGEVYKISPKGQSWTQVAPGDVRALAFQNNYIYGIAWEGSVFRIKVNGTAWEKVTQPLVTAIAVDKDNTIYGVGSDRRVYKTQPHGTWALAFPGDVIDLAIDKDYVYGVSLQNKVVRIRKAGGVWEETLSSNWPDKDIHSDMELD